MKKKYLIQQFIKYIIALAILMILSTFILTTIYSFNWTYENISNSLFIINAPAFLIALMIQSGALRATLGVSYTAKAMLNPTKTKDQYDTFQDYVEEKSLKQKRDVLYLLFAALTLIIAAFLFAQLYMETVPNM
jgi:uncharacterized membrane protein (DUF485 family)